MASETTITKTVFYPYSPAKVWDAITSTAALTDWFMDTDFKAEVGSSYIMKASKSGDGARGIVKEVNKPNKLSYSWMVPGSEIETLVEWILKEKDNGTEVTLVHSGFESYAESDREHQFNKHAEGWDYVMGFLTEYLNSN